MKPRASATISIIIVYLVLGSAGCRRSPEEKAAKFMESGKKHAAAKDYARALLDFRNVIQLRPKDAEAHYQIGLMYLAKGDVSEAVPYLAKAIQLNPKHTGAQLKIAELMTKSNKKPVLEEAVTRSRRLVNETSGDSEALNVLAMAELRLGRIDDAEHHVEEALARVPENLRASATLASTKLAKKDLAGAETAMKEAIRKAPTSVEAALAMAQLSLITGKAGEAESQFRRAVALNPKSGEALFGLAALQHRTGRADEAEQTLRQLSALPDPEYKSVYGEYLQRRGKHDQAIAEFEKLAKADPNDRPARTRLLSAYATANRKADVERMISTALQKNPKDADALLQRGAAYMDAGKMIEAGKDLSTVLNYRPESPEAHLLLGKLEELQGRPLVARQEFSEALRLRPDLSSARIALARNFRATGAAAEAVRLLNAPDVEKNFLPIALERNWAFLANRQYANFEKGVDAVLQFARVPEGLLQDGVRKLRDRKYAPARSVLVEALARVPEDPRVLTAVMQSYVLENKQADGIAFIGKHAAGHPNSAVIQQFLGEQLLAAHDGAAARTAFTAAANAKPHFAAAQISLATMDEAEGKRDEGKARLSTLLQGHPENTRARLLLAQWNLQSGNKEAAIEHYGKILETDRSNTFALNNIAYLLSDAGRLDEALKYAQEAKELAPNNSAVDDTIGWIFYRKGLYSTAVKYLEVAAANGPATRKHHLAMAYYKAGEVKRAEQTLRLASAIDGNSAEATTARQLIVGR